MSRFRGCLCLVLPLASGSVLTVRSATGETISLSAKQTSGTPDVRSGPLRLLRGGDGCEPFGSAAEEAKRGGLTSMPFALFTRRGTCSFDVKMRNAIAAGASALMVSDSLAGEYRPLPNATAATMRLHNPCIVECDSGRGDVDPSGLAVADVLAGLPGNCGRGCPTELCAFSGAAASAASGLGPAGREVCCARSGAAMEMALPETIGEGVAVAALYLSLASGVELDQFCFEGGAAHIGAARRGARSCEVEVGAAHRSWDLSAVAIWLLGSCTAALAAYIAGAEQHAEDQESVSKTGAVSRASEEATLDAQVR